MVTAKVAGRKAKYELKPLLFISFPLVIRIKSSFEEVTRNLKMRYDFGATTHLRNCDFREEDLNFLQNIDTHLKVHPISVIGMTFDNSQPQTKHAALQAYGEMTAGGLLLYCLNIY